MIEKFWIPIDKELPHVPDGQYEIEVFFRTMNGAYSGTFQKGTYEPWKGGFYDFEYVWTAGVTHWAYIPELEQ